jgi:hypothetical protein
MKNRLAPSHTKKGAKRYRYYIRADIANLPALRIPAQELEDLVINALVDLTNDQSRLMGVMEGVDDVLLAGGADAGSIAAKLKAAEHLGLRLKVAGPERVDLIRKLVASITVGETSAEITVRTPFIWQLPIEQNSEQGAEQVFTISIPAQLKRCGLAVRLIIKSPHAANSRGPDGKLVALLAKAQQWFKRLSSGQADSVLSIALDQGMESRDVTRVIYLAFLAPDIVQKIVAGEHPEDFNAKKILALAPLPLDWNEQRKVLGFAK